MNENIYQILINKKIDGLISADEESELNRLLSESPEARKYYREMQQTVQMLTETPQIQPSENLKKRVMNTIDLDKYASKPNNVIISRWRLMPKTGLAFAAGLLLGIIMYALLLPGMSFINSPAESEMYGTIGITNKGTFQIVSEIPVKTNSLEGLIMLKNSDDMFILDINLSLLDNAEILVGFNTSEVRFAGFMGQNNLNTFIDSGADYIRITGSENTHCNLYLDKLIQGKTSVSIQVQSTSGEYLKKELSLDSN